MKWASFLVPLSNQKKETLWEVLTPQVPRGRGRPLQHTIKEWISKVPTLPQLPPHSIPTISRRDVRLLKMDESCHRVHLPIIKVTMELHIPTPPPPFCCLINKDSTEASRSVAFSYKIGKDSKRMVATPAAMPKLNPIPLTSFISDMFWSVLAYYTCLRFVLCVSFWFYRIHHNLWFCFD